MNKAFLKVVNHKIFQMDQLETTIKNSGLIDSFIVEIFLFEMRVTRHSLIVF